MPVYDGPDDEARLDRKEGGGYLLTFGDGDRVSVEESRELVALSKALGRGLRDLPSCTEREAAALASEEISGAVYGGERVTREDYLGALKAEESS